MTGVVLVDDIDLHLHPSWQRTVVSKLASTLPRLQFIVTSHSPLVAGNLYAENIRVVSNEPDGRRSSSSTKSRFTV
jgi:predicted ATP-binding protein involved in virulence